MMEGAEITNQYVKLLRRRTDLSLDNERAIRETLGELINLIIAEVRKIEITATDGEGRPVTVSSVR